jgi:hypothetical protein
MLGLGSSIVNSNFAGGGIVLLGTYTSDFANGTDSWSDFGISAGTQTITANQSVGGTDGVLKISYDADETIQFGIELATPWGENFEVGDYITVQFSFYSEDVDPADGSNFGCYFQAGSSYSASRRVSVAGIDGEWGTDSVTLQQIDGGGSSNLMRFGFSNQTNAPGIGDSWYLDSVTIEHWR